MARRTATRRLILLAALALASCGDEDVASLDGAPAPPIETYPIRRVFVARGPGPFAPEAPNRKPEEARARALTAYERLRAGEDFAKVVAEVSDEAATRPDGGFVGFIGRHLGDDEDLVRTVVALPEGGIAEPMESPEGFAVVQRLPRAEGMALEAKVSAAVEGFMVPWHDLARSVPPTQTREQAYAEAAAALSEVLAGRVTASRAASRILGARPVNTGLRRGSDPVHAKAVEVLLGTEPGAWAPPTETRDGWLVAKRLPYERFSISHLLVTHDRSPGRFANPKRTEPEAVTRADEALARLRKDPSLWEAVVREYSDDADSRDRGGRIGDVCNVEPPTRRPPPEVEEEARRLKPGEISEVLPGRLGAHVLRREP